MNWEQLLSTKRTGQENIEVIQHDRTQFQRDFDRLIFSSPFRRLQDKTQVFPLPGSVFVHNRLTHSLEVACVGRSLGNNVSRFLKETMKTNSPLADELGSVTAAACLAHDMGNPPFGHSGEKAISDFFINGEGKRYHDEVADNLVWNDFIDFEGNANTLRLLVHQFAGRRRGGFALTYTTVASTIKYPRASGNPGYAKYGYFQSEKEVIRSIANELGITEQPGTPGMLARHPLVYLVEAADDICYQIMDIEDAHKLGIIPTGEAMNLLLSFFCKKEDKTRLAKIKQVCTSVTDPNEQVAFLRAGVIGKLVNSCSSVFCQDHDTILEGSFQGSLVSKLEGSAAQGMKNCQRTGLEIIYKHPSVVEIEIAGFKILRSLLNEFINAVMNPSNYYSGLLLPFIPGQYMVADNAPVAMKIRIVVDFISGMTDVYALDLFRKINGIGLAGKRLKG